MRNFPRRLGWWIVGLVFAAMAIDRVLVGWPRDDSKAHPVIAIAEEHPEVAARAAAPQVRGLESETKAEDVVEQVEAERVEASSATRVWRMPRPGTGVVWRGRVELEGEQRALERATGGWRDELFLGFRCDGLVHSELVDLDGADFEFEVPYHLDDIEEVVVLQAFVARRNWRPIPEFASFTPPFASDLVVRLRRPPSCLLEVVDERDGTRLEKFWLSHNFGFGIDRPEVSPRTNPVDLSGVELATDGEGLLRLNVSAQGWCAQALDVDLDDGGEHVVRLQRAGNAILRWSAPTEWREALDRLTLHASLAPSKPLRTAKAEPASEPDERARVVTLDLPPHPPKPDWPYSGSAPDLAPGTYRASLRLPGTEFYAPRELATAEFTVQARKTVDVDFVTLAKLDLPVPQWSFEVELPPEYATSKRPRIVVWTADGSARGQSLEGIAPGLWKSAALLADRQAVQISLLADASCATRVELAGNPEVPLRVKLPRPSVRRVRLHCASSPAPFLPDSLPWSVESDVGGRTMGTAKGTDGVYEIVAVGPTLRIEMPPDSSLRVGEGTEATFTGAGEHVLTVFPGPSVRLAAFDEGRPLDVPRTFLHLRAFHLGDRTHAFDLRRIEPAPGGAAELLLWFAAPGEYELELPDVVGFEPPPRTSVFAREGPTQLLQLHLDRKR